MGVGPNAAQLIITHQATLLISGMVGGNTRDVLVAAGIPVYAYRARGTVEDALDRFNKKTFEHIA